MASDFSARTASARRPCRSPRWSMRWGVPNRSMLLSPRSNQVQVSPVPQLAPLRPYLDLGERRFQAERKQDARAVGADLDAGADLLELARLFVNRNVDAALEQGQRRAQSADAGADDKDMFRCAHGD